MHRPSTWVAIAGVALLLVVWTYWRDALDLIQNRKSDFDIVGMLKQVDKTNTALIKANDALLQSLDGVREEAGAVTGVHARLQGLEAGLQEQQQVLDELHALTRDQADLSRSLQQLTAGVKPSTASIADTAAAQAAALGRMSGVVSLQASDMAQIGSYNRSIAGKLRRAEELSATVLSSMP